MDKPLFKMLLTFAALLLFSNAAQSAPAYGPGNTDWSGNLNLLIASKSLDEGAWWPADEQTEAGISFDFKHIRWPVSLCLEYSVAEGDGSDGLDRFESETTELDLGVRKYWPTRGATKLYLGGGIALIEGKFSGLGLSQSDEASGIWLGGGILWQLGRYSNIGLDIKASTADITLFGVTADAGGGRAAMFFGFNW